MQELRPLNELRPIIIGSVVSMIPEPYASSAANLMSFHRNADEKIKEAIARGEFDNLPGKGRPLDLDAYFATPEDLRIGYSLLKTADIIPEEMELLKQIEGLNKSLDSCASQIEKRTIQRQLSEKITNLNMRMERYRKKIL